MADPYIGEVRIFGFDYAPIGWAFCDGELLPTAQYQALFAVIGTIYGGDGQNNFGVPNLKARIPIMFGQGQGLSPYPITAAGGVTEVTLTTSQIPSHNHQMVCTNNAATTNIPAGYYPSKHMDDLKGYMYRKDPGVLDAQFSPNAVTSDGSNQPHSNLQPYLPLNFCIATEGVFPVRS